MSNATPLTVAEKKPVKKLFDRPATAETAIPPTLTATSTALPKKVQTSPKKPVAKSVTKSSATHDLDGIIPDGKAPNVYGLAMLVLIILMLWTGVLIVEQVQDYHAQYGVLQKLKREHRTLEIEHQRLLIEQQTFSATPQIAKRAVAELNMYYPQLSDRMILQSNPPANSVPAMEVVPDDVNSKPSTSKPSTKTPVAPQQSTPANNNGIQAVANAPVVKSEATQ